MRYPTLCIYHYLKFYIYVYIHACVCIYIYTLLYGMQGQVGLRKHHYEQS